MPYRTPVSDIQAVLTHVIGFDNRLDAGFYPDLSQDLVQAVVAEAGKFAEDRIAPINRDADKHGAFLKDGHVVMPPGFGELYRDWAEAGWNGLMASADFGGQGLPCVVNSICTEIWNAASPAFGLGPLLTQGAIEAISAHASDAIKQKYLPNMISGVWTGTMNLTEPQAGSDLNALRARAEPVGDGTYRITGQKIFITWGDHDMTENIIHLVLARLPDAPPGTRGISLFVVPKRFVNDDGSLGEHNDVRCHSLEHKMGIHASPTCTMVFGDNGGAIGWMVGEPNRGLAAMFTMMNNARLAIAVQGVGLAERATQKALHFANERRQGRAPGASGEGMSAIADHPDVKRMLATMRAMTQVSRALCYRTAAAIDGAHFSATEDEQKAAHNVASLLTPVAKAFATDIANEVASLCVQVHGGMGFIEETGAAQFMRDARIFAIYEGTNGIQAIDLVTRKLPLDGGKVVADEIAALRATVREVAQVNDPAFGRMAQRLGEAVDALDRSTTFLLNALKSDPQAALAGATPYLRVFGLAAGGVALAKIALAARRSGDANPIHADQIGLARYFAENHATAAAGLADTVMDGAASLDSVAVAV